VENQPGYFREVQKDIEKYNIGEHIVFTGYREDMPNIMPSLDLVVTLSAGSIVVEAMAAGRPVIGTDIGSASETIDNSVTGLLLPQDDIHAVSEAIILLLHDGDMRARMGSAGRKRVEKLFDIQKTARATEAVYERLLSRTRLPAR
jgi:glycosyltransferase involved in cell wall biosynthesis